METHTLAVVSLQTFEHHCFTGFVTGFLSKPKHKQREALLEDADMVLGS